MAKVELSGRLVAVPLDDPALVVGSLERDERQAELLDGLEAAHPQQVLLQGPDEPLGAAVALRLAHERRRALDAEEADLGPEVVAHVPAPVVVAQPQAGGDVLGERAAALAHRLLDRLERLEAVGAPAGMDADALGRAVVDGDESRGLALAGPHRGQVGPPHHVAPLGRDRAVVGPRAVSTPGTLVRQQAVLAREPQDAAPAGADAGEAQPRPQLAVALAVEGAVGQELPDRPDQVLVRHRAPESGPPTHVALRCAAVAVDGRPRAAPQARDPLDPVGLGCGGRDPPAHRLDLLRAKGRAVSSRPILASRSSAVMVSSPTFAFRRPISASRASAGRLLSEASPPARNASRQPLSSAAVTPSPRETSSRSSPRSSLSTASCLRRADIRRRGAGPSPPAWVARSDGPAPIPSPSCILHLLAVPYLQVGVSANCRPGEPRSCRRRRDRTRRVRRVRTAVAVARRPAAPSIPTRA